MAAFYESYPHITLFVAMCYLVISAAKGGTKILVRKHEKR
jgi:hypothetical protein